MALRYTCASVRGQGRAAVRSSTTRALISTVPVTSLVCSEGGFRTAPAYTRVRARRALDTARALRSGASGLPSKKISSFFFFLFLPFLLPSTPLWRTVFVFSRFSSRGFAVTLSASSGATRAVMQRGGWRVRPGVGSHCGPCAALLVAGRGQRLGLPVQRDLAASQHETRRVLSLCIFVHKCHVLPLRVWLRCLASRTTRVRGLLRAHGSGVARRSAFARFKRRQAIGGRGTNGYKN